MFAAARNVNRISVELITRTDPMATPSTLKCDRLLNPVPRTDTTVPAGNQPSPGTMSAIATLPPTVTVPGVTIDGTMAPATFHSDEGSSVNCERLPTVASS